jgi:protein disulfide-isomerase A1
LKTGILSADVFALKTGKSLVHFFVSSTEERQEYVTEILPLAKKYAEYLHFTTIDVGEYPEMLQVYGHRPGATKVLSVYQPSTGSIFPYQGTDKVAVAAVERFLMDIIEGRVKPWSGQFVTEGDVSHEEL